MNYCELKTVITKIIGLNLTHISFACEMMSLGFEQYTIHAQCLTRIVKNNDILVTTLDYQSWDGEHEENNDEWYNCDKYRTEIEGGKVLSVEVNPLYDLTITLDNDITIQILIQNSYAHYDEEFEQYRFFEFVDRMAEPQKELPKHYVVYSKHIDNK